MHTQLTVCPFHACLFGFNGCTYEQNVQLFISTVAGVSLQNFPVGTAAFLGTTKVFFSYCFQYL